jgi:F-type H+-transporting ATPase subunit delta
MAELATIARPYAEAAFRLARDAGALPAWSQMLRFVSGVVADPRMAAALDNPALSAGAKEALIVGVTGDRLDPVARNFVRVLVGADRLGVLPQIQTLFETLKDDADGVAKARIESAFPLADAQVRELTAALERHFGKRIEATVSVEPALIGGARITVGDRVIDASVEAQLHAMATQLRT